MIRDGWSAAVVIACSLNAACSCNRDPRGNDPEPSESGGSLGNGAGGESSTGGRSATGGEVNHVLEPATGPEYAPAPGFESCKHAEVKADCEQGWCRLPPSCVVIGSPEDTWQHGRYTEIQTEVNLTRAIEVQQMEMSRAEWKQIASILPVDYKQEDDGECLEDDCPINNITWWEAIHAANLLSEARGLDPCYEPVNCEGELGQGLACEGIAEPERSVYECEGYRLPTWAEAEYAARAGTVSDFYTGNLTVYDNNNCHFDENLDKAAWYCFNAESTAHVRGGKLPNGFGLYDLLGNVWEWVNERDRTTQAQGGEDPSGSIGRAVDRLLYGGAYNIKSYSCNAANLFAAPWDIRGPQAGFRLYRTLFDDSERSKAIVSE